MWIWFSTLKCYETTLTSVICPKQVCVWGAAVGCVWKRHTSNQTFYHNETETYRARHLFPLRVILCLYTRSVSWYYKRHIDSDWTLFHQSRLTLSKISRAAQLTLRVKLSWLIFLWSMAGRKWARHTKSQQCLTTQAVLHPVDHLIKPIMALHLRVLLHGRVQAILSVFRSMKLDVNLHLFGLATPMWPIVVNERRLQKRENWSHSVGFWARGQFVMWLHLSPRHWTKGK